MSRVVLVVAVGGLVPRMGQRSIVRLAVVVAEIPAVVVVVVVVAVPVNFVWLIVNALLLFSARSGEILARGISSNGHRIVCKCPVLLCLSIGLSVVWILQTGLRLQDYLMVLASIVKLFEFAIRLMQLSRGRLRQAMAVCSRVLECFNSLIRVASCDWLKWLLRQPYLATNL